IDPAITFRRPGIDEIGAKDHFKGTAARHPAGQILGSAAARRDAHQRLALGKSGSTLGGKCHVGRRDELRSATASQTGELYDRHLRLLPQQLAECLEGIETVRSL